ncbi:hypothetical protein FT663_03681 [Candidozyma haemuli var. vulneris]|uniref:Exoribonuclease phosphorolytic domain-containing protein n=1 Tax=Candidozyma haemuli TaxID=45357 RepID=A0A2V1ASX9_9ASCO|nr:hypothetical protein CXQ85_004465 [[Candida] haemuloni]KAF3987774.1 hypothetical protein FT662_03792 [[Candida] haemuloni var. vulneris]KAF3989259.1 hypothetical protein FT663_03681 [[Candida] haemuloni var. vulneris]PVH20949.1 hypothetical protein CXQ85_004465 [[Candida] haemuloni]
MSTDRRRITGPTDAKTPQVGISSGKTPTAKFSAAENAHGVRRFFLKSGLTKNANGSAYLEVGNTILEVSVYGPRPIRGSFIDRASFSVECKFLPYLTQPNEVIFNAGDKRTGRTGLTNIEHRISTYVETAFLPSICVEKYPKSTIDVFVNVIAFDPATGTLPNLISWVVNCTALAMVDSGIEVKDLVTAGHAKLTGESIDLDSQLHAEKDTSTGTECVASYMKMHDNEMVAFWVECDESKEVEAASLEKLLSGCDLMSTEVRKNLNGYLLRVAREADVVQEGAEEE